MREPDDTSGGLLRSYIGCSPKGLITFVFLMAGTLLVVTVLYVANISRRVNEPPARQQPQVASPVGSCRLACPRCGPVSGPHRGTNGAWQCPRCGGAVALAGGSGPVQVAARA